MFGNTTTTRQATPSTEAGGNIYYRISHHILLYLILLSSLIGNIVLSVALVTLQTLKKLVDKLILNLAVCNMLLVVVSIPITTVIGDSQYYPFGLIGCKLIDPLSTYLANASVLTLVAIAFERWHVVSTPFLVWTTKKKQVLVLVCVHVVALVAVIPFFQTLNISTELSTPACVEQWSHSSRQIYTLILFLLQYGVPIPLMLFFYSRAWIVVRNANKKMLTTVINNSSDISYQVANRSSLSEPVSGSSTYLSANSRSSRNSYDDVALTKIRKMSIDFLNEIGRHAKRISQNTPRQSLLPKTHRRKGEYLLGTNEMLSKLTQKPKSAEKYLIKKTSCCTDECSASGRFVVKQSFVDSVIEKTELEVNTGNKLRNDHFYNRQNTSKNLETCRKPRALTIKRLSQSQMSKFAQTVSLIISPTGGVPVDDGITQLKAFQKRLYQSRDLLKMFTVVVAVFMIFMLPNQILWLLIDFQQSGNDQFNYVIHDVAYLLTYTNCVFNPWIYGRLNKKFKRDFRNLFKRFRSFVQNIGKAVQTKRSSRRRNSEGHNNKIFL